MYSVLEIVHVCVSQNLTKLGGRPIKCNWGGWVSTVSIIIGNRDILNLLLVGVNLNRVPWL